MFFHPLQYQLSKPQGFTNPFYYSPSEVVKVASLHLSRYILSCDKWSEELSHGKMFGVLVVENELGEVGYLAAFSGNLGGKTLQPFFVPPIFDLHSVSSFFREEERRISSVNREIREIQDDINYQQLIELHRRRKSECSQKIIDYKCFMAQSKTIRSQLRRGDISESQNQQLIKESQFQKAELKRIEHNCQESIATIEGQLMSYEERIDALKTIRQKMSQELQRRIFESYKILNHKGEQKTLIEIFKDCRNSTPPSGAGECAAPKLLQYAFANGLKSISMGEFWWGSSPKGEVRHHGEYYTACKSKCEPILGYMLYGMTLESGCADYSIKRDVKVVYQDKWLAVIDKPAGMLSVKGNVELPSVEELLLLLFPQRAFCKVVHRLDMDTSGIIIVAFDLEVYTNIQQQFKQKVVCKEYLALLDGVISNDVGEVDLPISADYDLRPRQKIDYINGKSAHTSYRVISYDAGKTRISFTPHTGRTHQLRLHSAHEDGLGAPIVGDRLYGHPSTRLMLQAIKISFIHPIKQQRITFEVDAEF